MFYISVRFDSCNGTYSSVWHREQMCVPVDRWACRVSVRAAWMSVLTLQDKMNGVAGHRWARAKGELGNLGFGITGLQIQRAYTKISAYRIQSPHN